MDLDARVSELMKFKASVLKLFPGGVMPTDEQIADHRAGNTSEVTARVDIGDSGELLETVKDLSDHVLELSEAVTSLQQFEGELRTVLAWFTKNQTALEGLIAGPQGAAQEAPPEKAAEVAVGTEEATETAPQAAGEPVPGA